MVADKENYIYIVAGDEMARLMSERYPDRRIIPFREDLSRGSYDGFSIGPDFIRERATLWAVSSKEYIEKLEPIINLDTKEAFVLCFGEDECCRSNLEFMIGYLKSKGYTKPLKVQIVDEYTLELLREYWVEH